MNSKPLLPPSGRGFAITLEGGSGNPDRWPHKRSHSERQAEGRRPPDNGPGPRDWQVVWVSLSLAVAWPCPPTGSTQSGVWWTLQPHLLQPRAGRRCTGLCRGPDATRVPAVCSSLRVDYSGYEGHRMQPQTPPCPCSHNQHTLQAKGRGCGLLRTRQETHTHTHTHTHPPLHLAANRVSQEGSWLGRDSGAPSGPTSCRTPGAPTSGGGQHVRESLPGCHHFWVLFQISKVLPDPDGTVILGRGERRLKRRPGCSGKGRRPLSWGCRRTQAAQAHTRQPEGQTVLSSGEEPHTGSVRPLPT